MKSKPLGANLKQRILYIHGFNSSPKSMKAVQTKQYFEENFPKISFHCPQIASSPNGAIEQLDHIIAEHKNDQWLLLGSSLGGYFSTYFAEKYQLKAVLINPAVKPYLLLSDIIGEQTNPYTGEVYQVTTDYIEHLKVLDIEKIEQNNYLVMVQTGDEVLDYRQATDKYAQSTLIVQEGGDHSFINFEQMLPDIVKFFQLT